MATGTIESTSIEEAHVKKGHRLAGIPDFPEDVCKGLARYSLATAEEFLAQVEVDEPGIRAAVETSDDDFERAKSLAREAVGPEFAKTIETIRNAPDHALGARPPTSQEFDEVMRQQ